MHNLWKTEVTEAGSARTAEEGAMAVVLGNKKVGIAIISQAKGKAEFDTSDDFYETCNNE
jgi:hypothetical protein